MMLQPSAPSPVGFSRRQALRAAGGAAAVLLAGRAFSAEPPKFGLGFSLYGLKTTPLLAALDLCAELGYGGVELPALPDWPGAPENLPAAARAEFKARLGECKLRLAAVMENLPLLADGEAAEKNIRRLRAAAELARELASGAPPLVETVLGGQPGTWAAVKNAFVDRLGRWCETLAPLRTPLAIKAHIGNALQTPADLTWLLAQVNSPWLVAAFDYSHFQLQGLSLNDCLDSALPRARFIHVKDARGAAGKFQFLLPGAGTIDYASYFRELAARKYAGEVVVEVSGQLHSQPGYDGPAAARASYDALSRAWREAFGAAYER